MSHELLLVYRVGHAAQVLGVSKATLYRLIQRGELQLVKLSLKASGIPLRSLLEYARRRGFDLHASATAQVEK